MQVQELEESLLRTLQDSDHLFLINKLMVTSPQASLISSKHIWKLLIKMAEQALVRLIDTMLLAISYNFKRP